MEETPSVEGTLVSDQTWISDQKMIHELEQKGYGETEKKNYFLNRLRLFIFYTQKIDSNEGKKKLILISLNECLKNKILKFINKIFDLSRFTKSRICSKRWIWIWF